MRARPPGNRPGPVRLARPCRPIRRTYRVHPGQQSHIRVVSPHVGRGVDWDDLHVRRSHPPQRRPIRETRYSAGTRDRGLRRYGARPRRYSPSARRPIDLIFPITAQHNRPPLPRSGPTGSVVQRPAAHRHGRANVLDSSMLWRVINLYPPDGKRCYLRLVALPKGLRRSRTVGRWSQTRTRCSSGGATA
jgi:hypothetical protein